MPNGSLTACWRARNSVRSQDNYRLLLHKLWGSLWKKVDVIALILSAGQWCCSCQFFWEAADEQGQTTPKNHFIVLYCIFLLNECERFLTPLSGWSLSLGLLEFCQGEFPCHPPRNSRSGLMCQHKAGSFSSFFGTGGCGSLLKINISNHPENSIIKWSAQTVVVTVFLLQTSDCWCLSRKWLLTLVMCHPKEIVQK